jgi:hypothetical protein
MKICSYEPGCRGEVHFPPIRLLPICPVVIPGLMSEPKEVRGRMAATDPFSPQAPGGKGPARVPGEIG